MIMRHLSLKSHMCAHSELRFLEMTVLTLSAMM